MNTKNVPNVTKIMLDEALDAWRVARDGAVLEQKAWNDVMRSHGALIESMRENGHTWAQADAEFKKISEEHQKALLDQWKHMDKLCNEYQKLLSAYKTQNPPKVP